MPSRTTPPSSSSHQPPAPLPSLGHIEHYDVAKHFAAILIDRIRDDWGPIDVGTNYMIRCALMGALYQWTVMTTVDGKSRGFQKLHRKLQAIEKDMKWDVINNMPILAEPGSDSTSPVRTSQNKKKRKGKGKGVKVEEIYSPPPPTQPMSHKAGKIPGPPRRSGK